MTIKRIGKCEKCRQPTVEHKTFLEPVDMFAPDIPSGTITPAISSQIKVWRKKPMYCEKHQPVSVL